MSIKIKQLLKILLNKEFHSGEKIASKLKVTRAAVWKIVNNAKKSGFRIEGITNQGYRLMDDISFLSAAKIKQALPAQKQQLLKVIDVFEEIDSTNTYLLQRIYEFSKIPRVCLTEMQTQGRGRFDRVWHSPYAQNIYLSILWKFGVERADFQGLSLVIAIAVADVLSALSLAKLVQLKWPNDIYIDGKKCGGILIETRGEMHHGAQVVIGLGLNVNMQKTNPSEISQEWISLSQVTEQSFDRNQLSAQLIASITDYLVQFDADGFLPFKSRFEQYDYSKGRQVNVTCHNTAITGTACGIDDLGRLQIKTGDGHIKSVGVGDLTITPKT